MYKLVPRLKNAMQQVSVLLSRCKTSVVPDKPTWQTLKESELPPEKVISNDLVNHLERLALVDFGNKEAVDRLAAAVRFADLVNTVDTTGVEPMYTVLENESLYLRSDEIKNNEDKKIVLGNAAKKEDDYFVAPPGNIPLKSKKKDYLQDSKSNTNTNFKQS